MPKHRQSNVKLSRLSLVLLLFEAASLGTWTYFSSNAYWGPSFEVQLVLVLLVDTSFVSLDQVASFAKLDQVASFAKLDQMASFVNLDQMALAASFVLKQVVASLLVRFVEYS